ncbi:MAG TPA: ABC transporter permease [Candidatus Izemoplasmatales bacterium]|nr:ABC transporter permease [Candidatus Izemoplasmatales bacterium]
MKTWAYAIRNSKEILRDPLNLAFGLGFPLVLILLLTAIQANIPVAMFELDQMTPGIAVFGLSFISLFSSVLIAKDRSSSFMLRMFSSPMTSKDFIVGYTLPLVPMSVVQVGVCFLTAMALGLMPTWNILLCILVCVPTMIFFIAIGLLCGSIFTDKQVGGICGALLTNLTGWLSGTWFDIDLVGKGFKLVAEALPFVHAVDAGRAALAGDYGSIFPDLWWVIGYAVVTMFFAIVAFKRKMQSD